MAMQPINSGEIDFSIQPAPYDTEALPANAFYVRMDRQWSAPMIVGPYESNDEAISAMDDSSFIDGECHEDCLDVWVEQGVPTSEVWEAVVIDTDDPYFYGTPF